jgi:hypothetical protein
VAECKIKASMHTAASAIYDEESVTVRCKKAVSAAAEVDLKAEEEARAANTHPGFFEKIGGSNRGMMQTQLSDNDTAKVFSHGDTGIFILDSLPHPPDFISNLLVDELFDSALSALGAMTTRSSYPPM